MNSFKRDLSIYRLGSHFKELISGALCFRCDGLLEAKLVFWIGLMISCIEHSSCMFGTLMLHSRGSVSLVLPFDTVISNTVSGQCVHASTLKVLGGIRRIPPLSFLSNLAIITCRLSELVCCSAQRVQNQWSTN